MNGVGLEAFALVIPLAPVLFKRVDATLFSARMKDA
jgi:hypothetical protein